MTGTMTILDRRGHSTVTWSTDLQETVDAANRRFNELLAGGYTAFAMDDAHHGEQLQEFSAETGTVLMVPRMVGG
jgi:hypothetical protein